MRLVWLIMQCLFGVYSLNLYNHLLAGQTVYMIYQVFCLVHGTTKPPESGEMSCDITVSRVGGRVKLMSPQ